MRSTAHTSRTHSCTPSIQGTNLPQFSTRSRRRASVSWLSLGWLYLAFRLAHSDVALARSRSAALGPSAPFVSSPAQQPMADSTYVAAHAVYPVDGMVQSPSSYIADANQNNIANQVLYPAMQTRSAIYCTTGTSLWPRRLIQAMGILRMDTRKAMTQAMTGTRSPVLKPWIRSPIIRTPPTASIRLRF